MLLYILEPIFSRSHHLQIFSPTLWIVFVFMIFFVVHKFFFCCFVLFLFVCFLILIFTLFYFTILYWFCHTLTWIHHGCTCVPKHDFECYLASVWNECDCSIVWTFFGIALLWDWNENWLFPVLWPWPSFSSLLTYWVQHFHSIIF